MIHSMRRSAQQLPETEIERILQEGSHGVLAVCDGDEPYAVPLSYVYERGHIYFHSAVTGHKLGAIASNNRVSFCVVGRDEVQPERFSTRYESVIAFGRAAIVTDSTLKRHALEMLVQKYSPGYQHNGKREIEQEWDHVQIVEIAVQHCTGKRSAQ